jgi:hypothetical protein
MNSTGNRQPTGTTHFQFRPNQFVGGIGGGKAAVSISQAISIGTFRKATRIPFCDDSAPVTFHFSRGSGCSALAKA